MIHVLLKQWWKISQPGTPSKPKGKMKKMQPKKSLIFSEKESIFRD